MSHPSARLASTQTPQSTIAVRATTSVAGVHYTFGDGATAADRLALLAAVFEPSSARLLRVLGYLQPRQAVDLGCGPGWSTRLVNTVLAPARTLGLEQSPALVARARAAAPPGVEYRVHEVTSVPFPGDAPDLIYSRFLLTHLRQPEQVIAAWGSAAAPRATLVIEETADMVSDHPAFARYYQLVDALQSGYGQRMRVGADLCGPFGGGWTSELNLLTPLSLPAQQMARLHAMNIATWRQDAHASAAFAGDELGEELDRLSADLTAIADGDAPAPPVRLIMRQLVLAK
jgi:trans-aconitate 2-methyltransferase